MTLKTITREKAKSMLKSGDYVLAYDRVCTKYRIVPANNLSGEGWRVRTETGYELRRNMRAFTNGLWSSITTYRDYVEPEAVDVEYAQQIARGVVADVIAAADTRGDFAAMKSSSHVTGTAFDILNPAMRRQVLVEVMNIKIQLSSTPYPGLMSEAHDGKKKG